MNATAPTMSHKDSKRGTRNAARNVEEGSSEKPHDPKTFKRPMLLKETAIGTSATIQQRNDASLWFAPVSWKVKLML